MSPNERKILIALAENHSEFAGYCSFAYIASCSGIPREKIRRTVRSLARKGLAEYGKGLWTEDGDPAGSGYKASAAGMHLYWNDVVVPASELPPQERGDGSQ